MFRQVWKNSKWALWLLPHLWRPTVVELQMCHTWHEKRVCMRVSHILNTSDSIKAKQSRTYTPRKIAFHYYQDWTYLTPKIEMKVKKQIIQKRFTKIVSALLTIGLLPMEERGRFSPASTERLSSRWNINQLCCWQHYVILLLWLIGVIMTLWKRQIANV